MDTKLKRNKKGFCFYLLLPAFFLSYAIVAWTNMYDAAVNLEGKLLFISLRYRDNSFADIVGWKCVILGFFLAVVSFAAGIFLFSERRKHFPGKQLSGTVCPRLRIPVEVCLLAVGLWIWQVMLEYYMCNNIYITLGMWIDGLGYYGSGGSWLLSVVILPIGYLFCLCLAGLVYSALCGELRKNSLIFRFIIALTQRRSIRAKVFMEQLIAVLTAAGLAAGAVFSGAGRLFTSWEPFLGVAALIFLIVTGILAAGRDSAAGEMETLAKGLRAMAEGEYPEKNPFYKGAMLYRCGEDLVKISNATREGIEKGIAGEKLKVELISNVSHDLRTPLTAIIGYGEELSAMELPAGARECVEKLNHKSFYLKNMVEDLFDMSKASAGASEFQISEFDVCRLVEQTLGVLDEKIQSSGFEIRRSYPQEPVTISGDGRRLHRVFQNLIDNALKYSLAGTRIYISVDVEAEWARVSVLNTSSYDMGQCAADLTERFVRGDSARSGEGSGIGLAIAKTYVDALGGEFNIYIRGDQFEAVVKMRRITKLHNP